MGIPDPVIYLVGSQFVEAIEISIFMTQSRIICARLIPPGVEGTMMAFSTTIIGIDMFAIRLVMGLILNQLFVGMNKDNMEEKYRYLTMFKFVGACLPILFIYRLVPTNAEVSKQQKLNINLINMMSPKKERP